MKAFAGTLMILFFFSYQAASQEIEPDSRYRSGGGYFSVGAGLTGVQALNDVLAANGLAEVDRQFISLGGGGYGVYNRLLLGGEGHGIFTQDASANGYQTSLSGGYGFFNLGYVMARSVAWKFYPMAGVGLGGMTLTVRQTEDSPAFEDILDEPERGVNLSTGGVLFNGSINFDFRAITYQDVYQGGVNGILLGIQLGYILRPQTADWSIDGTDVSGGPTAGPGGPYVRLKVGFGGSNRMAVPVPVPRVD